MNIAILGSSFDPPHNGHISIARNILKSGKISKVILMPVNIHPFGKKMIPSYHRLAMVKLMEPHFAPFGELRASRSKENIEVSDLEIKKNKTSYSINTLEYLQKQYPNDNILWIIGSDQLESFTKWKDWQKIISDFGLIIVPRKSFFHLEGGSLKNIIILSPKDSPLINISSSEIREKVKKKKSISNFVPKSIENYIIRHELYLNKEL